MTLEKSRSGTVFSYANALHLSVFVSAAFRDVYFIGTDRHRWSLKLDIGRLQPSILPYRIPLLPGSSRSVLFSLIGLFCYPFIFY
jgi:hypothetical protein